MDVRNLFWHYGNTCWSSSVYPNVLIVERLSPFKPYKSDQKLIVFGHPFCYTIHLYKRFIACVVPSWFVNRLRGARRLGRRPKSGGLLECFKRPTGTGRGYQTFVKLDS